jgi:hypothetical protein
MRRCVYLLALVVTGCAADAVVPVTPPSYADVRGEYAAAVTGSVNSRVGSVEVTGTFRLALTQADDTLAGRYQLELTLTDGASSIPIHHEGPVSGTVGEGSRPTVRLRIENDECPLYFMSFEGGYDPDLRQITVTGAVDAINTINGICHLATRVTATLQFWSLPASAVVVRGER